MQKKPKHKKLHNRGEKLWHHNTKLKNIGQFGPSWKECQLQPLYPTPKLHINWNNSQRVHHFPELIGKKMDLQRGLGKTGYISFDFCSLWCSSVVFGLEEQVPANLFYVPLPHASLEEGWSNTLGTSGEWLSLQGPSWPQNSCGTDGFLRKGDFAIQVPMQPSTTLENAAKVVFRGKHLALNVFINK